MKKIITIFLCVLGITSCMVHSKQYWMNENKKVEECRKKWIYKDLLLQQEAKVLLFSEKFNRGVMSYPNFLIVMTNNQDTIAFLDKDFSGNLETGDKIKLSIQKWSEAEKAIKKPAFVVQKKAKDNDLYCKVKEVFYGKIELLNEATH